MALPIIHHPDYVVPLPSGHRFPMTKYGLLRAELAARGLLERATVHRPDPAPEAWLTLAHDPTYIAAVADGSLAGEAQRRIGFPVTGAVARRSRLSAGGTTLAARLALASGIACQTAGGSHHAHRDFGAGYCVFNDVAVAAAVMRAEGRLRRMLILDCDVHQGDGTASIFAGASEVFTLSIHAARNYPHRKAASDLDIALADGTGDDAYLEALNAALAPALADHRPELVFYNAGVDPHAEDRLGRLALSEAGIAARERLVVAACSDRRIPLVTVVGGGYGEDRDRLARLHAHVIAAAAEKVALPVE